MLDEIKLNGDLSKTDDFTLVMFLSAVICCLFISVAAVITPQNYQAAIAAPPPVSPISAVAVPTTSSPPEPPPELFYENGKRRCGNGQVSSWSEEFNVSHCQKPQKPQCEQQGFVLSGWNYKDGKWEECMHPPLPACDEQTPDIYWADGNWECRPRCDSNTKSHSAGIAESGNEENQFFTGGAQENGDMYCDTSCSDGYTRVVFSTENVRCYSCPRQLDWLDITQKQNRKCHSLPECEADRISVRSRKGGQICYPTSEIVDDFWKTAFRFAGISDDDRIGKFIGGLAAKYEHPVFHRLSEEKSVWGMMAEKSINIAKTPIHVCIGHDCFCEKTSIPETSARCGLIGSTNLEYSLCEVYVWNTPEGIWFLMRADREPSCMEYYDRVSSGELIQASITLVCHSRNVDVLGYKEHEGTDYPFRVCKKGYIKEITIASRGKDKNTFVSALDNTDVGQYL